MTAILFDGVVQGLQLSLLAVGITLIYGLGGVLNLAHAQLAVAGHHPDVGHGLRTVHGRSFRCRWRRQAWANASSVRW